MGELLSQIFDGVAAVAGTWNSGALVFVLAMVVVGWAFGLVRRLLGRFAAEGRYRRGVRERARDEAREKADLLKRLRRPLPGMYKDVAYPYAPKGWSNTEWAVYQYARASGRSVGRLGERLRREERSS